MEDNKFVLEVSDLHTTFKTDNGDVSAVNGVSFKLEPGKTLGIVGESGSGKSVTAYSIMQILAENGAITGGSVKYKGEDITKLNKKKMADFRGKCCSIIFQDPMTSLNPVFTVGYQLEEAVLLHTDRTKKEAKERAIEMLTLVGVNEPEKRVNQYPHELSGGMRQRVMIAMALACEPDILIADEPTTALDVTIQAQILELMQSLQEKLGMAIIMVTHDLGVIASMCDEIIVMYGVREEQQMPYSTARRMSTQRDCFVQSLQRPIQKPGLFLSEAHQSICSTCQRAVHSALAVMPL
jgi:oligopeptide transport system ATP-binding protein